MQPIKDSLYNTHPDSGSTVEYGKGIVVGVVSTFLVSLPFHRAIAKLYQNLPEGYRRECIPTSWQVYLVIQHLGARQYLVDRRYCLIGETDQRPVFDFPIKNPIETEPRYRTIARPAWADQCHDDEFCGYWLF